MNQQSSEKRVSGRQGSNKGAQRTEAPMKSISDCSPERTGADREKRRAAADPSDPEAACRISTSTGIQKGRKRSA